jgi:hypothetical protein
MAEPAFYILFSALYTLFYVYIYIQIIEYKMRQKIIKEQINRLQIIEINIPQ